MSALYQRTPHAAYVLGFEHDAIADDASYVANLLTSDCSEGKCRIYCRAPSKEERQLMLKRPKLPSGFQECLLFICLILWPHTQHMEVPRRRTESEPQP